MPQLDSRYIAVLADMAGCPNRCRHCYIGGDLPNRLMSTATFINIVQQFRSWVRPGETEPFCEKMTAGTWYREPDYRDDYRELWQIEQELSTVGAAKRHELLSIWRLARDESYARWAREIGTKVCQISFFGLEKTTDYFVRRKGAFCDCLLATERLLDAGIRPRWQLFLTQRILPDLEDLLAITRELRLEERCRQLGGEFALFIDTPGPCGAAFDIEDLRPTVDALQAIPPYLAEKTLLHFGVDTLSECLGCAEGDVVEQLWDESQPHGGYSAYATAFAVTPQLDVYSNLCEFMPWNTLGNLKSDSLDVIIDRFESNRTPGLYASYCIPLGELAQRYGRKGSSLLHDRWSLADRWIHQWGIDSLAFSPRGAAASRHQ